MKSVMQEASSIIKAIEKGWLKAGKPREFSIKILEEPQHNFIGFTVQSAKIALFFEQKAKSGEQQRPAYTSQRAKPQTRKPYENQRRSYQEESGTSSKPIQSQKSASESRPSAMWNDELIAMASQWLKDTLAEMNRPEISFKTSANRFYLRLTIDRPIYQEEERERNLFRNFSLLMLQTLRNQSKRPLHGYKVVLTRDPQ